MGMTSGDVETLVFTYPVHATVDRQLYSLVITCGAVGLAVGVVDTVKVDTVVVFVQTLPPPSPSPPAALSRILAITSHKIKIVIIIMPDLICLSSVQARQSAYLRRFVQIIRAHVTLHTFLHSAQEEDKYVIITRGRVQIGIISTFHSISVILSGLRV